MSNGEVQKKVENLVRIFDCLCVNFSIDIPENLKAQKIFQDTLEKYLPPYELRVTTLAYSVLWESYHNKFPEATRKDYEESFLCSILGHKCFQETVAYVSSKIHKVPKIEDIEKVFSGPSEDGVKS